MTCQEFQEHLAEYVAGRLPAPQRAQMAAHANVCALCARAEASERALRARFGQASPVRACPDLWPRFASQLEAARPRRSIGRLWTFGSVATGLAVMAGLFCLHLKSPSPISPEPPVSTSVQVAEGTGVLQRVEDLRQMPMAAGDSLLQNVQDDPEERSLLLGDRNPEGRTVAPRSLQ